MKTYIAAVINKPSEIPTLRGIDNGVMVHPEHITAPDPFIFISLLPHVCNDLTKKKNTYIVLHS